MAFAIVLQQKNIPRFVVRLAVLVVMSSPKSCVSRPNRES